MIEEDGNTIYLSKGIAALSGDQPNGQFLAMAPGQRHELDIEHLQDHFPEKDLSPDDALVISALVRYRWKVLGIRRRCMNSFEYNLPDYFATDSSSVSD